jgi:hypothetical protein
MLDLTCLEERLEAVPVPDLDMAGLRTRQRARDRRTARRRIAVLMSVVVLLPALATAAVVHFFHPQVYQNGDSLRIYSHSATLYRPRTPKAMARITENLYYRIVLPRALPQRAKLDIVVAADSELLSLFYTCPQKRTVQFVIGPRALRSLNHPRPDPHRQVVITPKTKLPWDSFLVGDEIVRYENDCLTPTEMNRVRTAMVQAARSK